MKTSFKYSLCALAVSSLGYSNVSLAQQSDEQTAQVERIEVTGSRIKGVDLEGIAADGVIDDDTLFIRDPQPAHAGRKGVGGRQHVRQVPLLVRGGFQIEEDCARQACGLEIRSAVAAVQMPAGVQYS